MAIRLFDSLSRSLKELRCPDPNDPKDIFRFYNCGPTVYAPAHIGNFRTFVINDVIRRLLELEFGKDKVKHVRNLTDVDDRTIGQTQKENRPLAEITKKWTDIFHADCTSLNCLQPHEEPIATGFIKEQVNMIEVLMQKGNAYRAADGSVYFKLASFPGYGALSRISERELKVTNTVADADHKDSVSDFALWKAWKPEEDGNIKWPGPRGASEGRPGWHIECSAMSKALLGDTIDLHTGGVDLLFPHHENEIAQSQCCNGALLSHHWFHSEHLLVDGTAMSKSKGNYYTLGDLVAKGYSPMAVRYALLMGHPRKQLNFTLDSLHAAESALQKIEKIKSHLIANAFGIDRLAEGYRFLEQEPSPSESFQMFRPAWDAICDDLNCPAAFGAIFEASGAYSSPTLNPTAAAPAATTAARAKEDLVGLRKILFALGLNGRPAEAPKTEVPTIVKALAEKRWAARAAKDFAAADALRKELAAAGWSMLDGKDGYKLEPLKK